MKGGETMPIRWSAVKVSEAMYEVEKQFFLADQFIYEAKDKAEEAKKIDNLPEYMSQRINRLIYQLERMEGVKESIESIRKNIPDGAIEAERNAGIHGSAQSMI
jgi:regulator of sirC expression with transglutaminase-like and TPR domain